VCIYVSHTGVRSCLLYVCTEIPCLPLADTYIAYHFNSGIEDERLLTSESVT